jgi:redox-sensitive bicupin YhaK (pirin superfamily)
MGNYESLPRGCVQYMSAGTGVVHSEMNDGDKTTRFIQVRCLYLCCIHTL